MLKFTLKLGQLVCLASFLALSACHSNGQNEKEKEEQRENGEMESEEQEGEKEDGPMEIFQMEFEKTKDPALGYVPAERLWNAIQYTEYQKQYYRGSSILSGIWQERGPLFDSVGASGNPRGPSGGTGGFASGRVLSMLVDAADPTGNTVFVGAADGGLLKCTNFMIASSTPASPPMNWTPVDDFLDNLAITSICQDPTNPSTIYFSTGEGTSNADAVLGKGIWKSTDNGATFSLLPSSTGFTRTFKILCDNRGNIFLASRLTGGVYRSINGGNTWNNITPTGTPTICTDIELSSTGRLHVSLGYSTGTTTLAYRYSNEPTGVDSTSWASGTGLPTTGGRMELATKGDTLYAVPSGNGTTVVESYKSYNGGTTWVKANTTNYPTSPTSSQAWYDITLAINPDNASQIIIGGLDAYKSIDTGKTLTRTTAWVTAGTIPYVHADHHYMQWYKSGGENRVIIGCDGGAFLSRDTGKTYVDRNNGMAIKQFYSVAIHPTLPNYFLAGAQDNGSHQFKNPGLSYSVEVTGGDGAIVDIDQVNPQYQFTSYVYNQYRRSIDGGNSWASFNLNANTGRFINPFVYDGIGRKLYACEANNVIRRWDNPITAANQAGAVSTLLTVPALAGTNSSAFLMSLKTPHRLFVGTGTGKLVYIDSANTVTNTNVAANTTDISGPWGGVYIGGIAVGSSDQNIAIAITNYGVNNVWVTSNGGTSWTAIDGNLPDMPVRTLVFNPTNDNQLIIGTEAGVYTSSNLNGAATFWSASPGFPTVRTDMLKVRPFDRLIAAATHGRGLFTSIISQVLPLRNVKLTGNLAGDGIALLNWTSQGEDNKTRFVLQYSTDGVSFAKIAELPYTIKQYRHSFQAATGYYRIMAIEPNEAAVFSNIVSINNTGKIKGVQVRIAPNPVTNSAASFVVSSSEAGNYNWTLFDMQGRTLQTGTGTLTTGASQSQSINAAKLPSGMYRIRLVQGSQSVISAFTKQ